MGGRGRPVWKNRKIFPLAAKELDSETGYYYFGARYYDHKVSMWISTDPAIGKYLPTADQLFFPEVKFDFRSMPGIGGVYNSVNMNVYHYAGQNPVKITDPDGEYIISNIDIGSFRTKYSVHFRSEKNAKFLRVVRAMPGGTFWVNKIKNSRLLGHVFYDSSLQKDDVKFSTVLDIMGSITKLGKLSNIASYFGQGANVYGYFNDEKMDKFRQKALKGLGIKISDLRSNNPKMLKEFMNKLDKDIANNYVRSNNQNIDNLVNDKNKHKEYQGYVEKLKNAF